MGEGQRDGWDSESGEGDWERAEGGLRAEAESSENLEQNRETVRPRGRLQNIRRISGLRLNCELASFSPRVFSA